MNMQSTLAAAKKIPGFYSYRPVLQGKEVVIRELCFIFHEKQETVGEVAYTSVLLFPEEGQPHVRITAVFDDFSSQTISNDDPLHQNILAYSHKLLHSFCSYC
ncbi:hypothetical protein IMZ31_20540 (plasmid) [Pontibacillus sp. ALD_SL1]|uniref:hypothetical protein n=1 Tax=Pontibacillus sp. ALD_SL1 TaxID=2777185 RepID=UPI001A9722DC|nr:hypothetical protein [Pontibacillus sp. ALD_SL1]QST02938.1 hypothetical protein IMZ31_20540 [Pontibacillus sp. ALD_SL1]